jgi:hypothetical protein
MRVNWRWIIGIFFLLEVDSWQRIQGNKRVYRKKRDLNINEDNKYMEKLKEYDLKAQEYIINMGSFMYDKSREYFEKEFTEETVLEKWSAEYETQKVMEEKKKLEQKIREKEQEARELRDEIYKARDEEREKAEKNLEYFKTKEMLMIQNRKEEIEEAISINQKTLRERVNELEKKNKWYFDLYESKEKGTNYEEELYPKMLDYNDKYLNSIWDIQHIGQVMSEKADFHFKNKLTNQVIILDTKNNLPTNPIAKVENFERDVTDKRTNAIGGIMLANGKICNKKKFEINILKDKYLVYVSNFERDNIEFIFSILDQITDLSNMKEGTGDKNKLREILLDTYKRETIALENLEKQKKIIEKILNDLAEDYQKYFDEDITMDIKKKEISSSSVRIRDKTSTAIVDYEELEKERKVIGQRTKYYLQYVDKKGIKKVQYFSNNYARGQKVKSLEKENNEGENVIILN